MRCSVISLSSALFILQKITLVTSGEFFLAKDEQHFQDLLKKQLVPSDSIGESSSL